MPGDVIAVAQRSSSPSAPQERVRDILEPLEDYPAILPPLVDLAREIARKSHCPLALALRLARSIRERAQDRGAAGLVQALLQEFSLSSQEGVALMCLAEALLRIPDKATRDALIRDKIGSGQWEAHLGKSPSLFVNAATWGLLITGKLVATHSETALAELKTALPPAGFAIQRLEAITPSLEDVFVSLIEARDRADADSREVRR